MTTAEERNDEAQAAHAAACARVHQLGDVAQHEAHRAAEAARAAVLAEHYARPEYIEARAAQDAAGTQARDA